MTLALLNLVWHRLATGNPTGPLPILYL